MPKSAKWDFAPRAKARATKTFPHNSSVARNSFRTKRRDKKPPHRACSPLEGRRKSAFICVQRCFRGRGLHLARNCISRRELKLAPQCPLALFLNLPIMEAGIRKQKPSMKGGEARFGDARRKKATLPQMLGFAGPERRSGGRKRAQKPSISRLFEGYRDARKWLPRGKKGRLRDKMAPKRAKMPSAERPRARIRGRKTTNPLRGIETLCYLS